MVYLDYAADTPVCEEALKTFVSVSKEYIANPNAAHPLGRLAADRLCEATRRIAKILQVKESEIIYTSGASESNNLAINGAAQYYKKYGKHIITTYLEHSSVIGPVAVLQNQGYEVDYVDITPEGLVDIEQLKRLLREDTILVSICYVDSEIGLCQPVGDIAEVLHAYPRCLFHVDATQAVGKIPVNFGGIDLVSFAPHKFYGTGGFGVLIKKDHVMLEPQIRGGISITPYRSGTPPLALIAAAETALSLAVSQVRPRLEYVKGLHDLLLGALKRYPRVKVNSTSHSTPYILNISVGGVKSEELLAALAERGFCLSARSACCAPNTVSRPVYALTKDKKAALSTLRVSLSHLTTAEEIRAFLKCFDECYGKMAK